MTEQIPMEELEKFVRYSAWYNPMDRKVYQGRAPADNHQAAGMTGVGDIAAVDLKILLQEIIGLQRPVYNLRNMTKIVPMNALKASIPIYTKGKAQEKVPELVEPSITATDWAIVDFNLWKNVYPIFMSDEAQKRASVDVLGTQTQDGAGALTASENSQIDEVVEAGTSVSGHAWSDDANNPYDDLVGAMSTIASKGHRPKTVAANPLVWGSFFGNKFVKGQLAGTVYPDFTQGGGFQIPGLPGVTGFSDFAVTATLAIVADNMKIVLGNGPTEAARFRHELAGYDGYIIRQWLQPQIVLAEAVRVVTGVRA